jgi:hypothetical protein
MPLRRYPTKMKEYADPIIEQMARTGKLPVDWKDPISLLPRAEFHDRIAREFCTHLATSPNFKYTTNLRREMKNIDPIEEFLFHTRAGHCERFASALALLLRSQGIPTVLVLGFKGCEPTDVPGKYLVREEHAHAWVAALVQENDPAQKPGRNPVFTWRSLDPTPDGPVANESGSGNSWTHPALSWLQKQYRHFIAEYTSEQRGKAIAEFLAQATRTETIVSAIALVLGVLLLRVVLRRVRNKAIPTHNTPQPEWFIRLIDQLALSGLRQLSGETPFEFATRASIVLRNNSVTAPVADVPLDYVEAYYESRFGGKELPPSRLATLDGDLKELIRASGK